jgi:hypothetical protein
MRCSLDGAKAIRTLQGRVSFKVGAGIQRILVDRDDMDPFRLERRRRRGKRRIRFTP